MNRSDLSTLCARIAPVDRASAQAAQRLLDNKTKPRRSLGMLIHGLGADERDERGRPVRVDSLLLALNGGARANLKQGLRYLLATGDSSYKPVRLRRTHNRP